MNLSRCKPAWRSLAAALHGVILAILGFSPVLAVGSRALLGA